MDKRQRIEAAIWDYATAKARTIMQAFAMNGIHTRDFYEAMNADEAISRQYDNAKKIRADHYAEQSAEVFYDETLDSVRAAGLSRALQWLAERRNREAYGQRVDMNISEQISISGAIELANTRILLPSCYPGDDANRQAIDVTPIPIPDARDKQSRTDDPAGIFDD